MIDEFDAAEVAAGILGIDDPDVDEQQDDIDQSLYDEYGIDLQVFTRIVEALIPFCAEGRSPLTGNHYRGFAKDGAWLAKGQVGDW